MNGQRSGQAADFLMRHSDLVHSRRRLPEIHDILIVDSTTSPLLPAIVRLMFGYDLSVRMAASLGATLDAISAHMPELVILDQGIPPAMLALDILPMIRRCGYSGAVLVTAMAPEPAAVRALLDAGAADVIDRDELDSARIAEALLSANSPQIAAAE